MNKQLFIGALVFGVAAAAGYMVKLRNDQIRKETAENEVIEAELAELVEEDK